MTETKIRDAHDGDVADIVTVFALGCTWGYRDFFPPEVLADYTPERQMQRWTGHLANLPPHHHILVASQDDNVVGFIELGPATSASRGGVGEVHYVFVHPSHMRCGIGGRLMCEGETWLAQAGYPTAVLWVFRDNTRARTFYERLGWTATGNEGLEPTLVDRGYTITECEYSRPLVFSANRPADGQ